MSQGSLQWLLHATNRRWLFVRLARASFLGALVFTSIVFGAVCLDGIVALPNKVRIAIDIGLGCLSFCGLLYLISLAYKNRFDSRRVARLIEQRSGITNSSLINAVDFHSEPTHGSSALLAQTIRTGDAAAATLEAPQVVSLRPATRAFGWLMALSLAILICFAATPRFFVGGFLRLIDPQGNHPAFSLIQFDVQITPEEIVSGASATIEVNLSGSYLPTQANVIFVDEANASTQLPMLVRGKNEYALEIARVDQSRQFFIDTPKGRSKVYDLGVVMVPQFESITVSYTYPKYTNWSPVQRLLNAQGIRGLAGTQVHLAVRSNIPLESGNLQIDVLGGEGRTSRETVDFHIDNEDPCLANAYFSLHFNGVGYLSLVSKDGVPSRDPRETKIAAIPDRRPLIDIVDPEPYLVVVEDWSVPVVIRAADDVGISNIEIHPSVNGWATSKMDLPTVGDDRRARTASHEFDLAEIGARAGDTITYYASAYDVHPDPPQFSDTERYVIQVISQEDYVDLARRRYRMQQLEAEIKGLREKLKKVDEESENLRNEMTALQDRLTDGAQLTSDEQRRLSELQDQLQQFSQQATTLADELNARASQPELYDVERPYTESLDKLAEQLRRQAESAAALKRQFEQLQRSRTDTDRRQETLKQMQQLQEQLGQQQDLASELQDNQHDAKMLGKADDVLAAADRLRNVILEQRDLADRMAEYRNIHQLSVAQQQRVDRMAKQQEMLQQELFSATEQLQNAADAAAEQLPKTAKDARELCNKISEMNIRDDQQRAAKSARNGRGRTAHQAADDAAGKLESLMSDCPSGQAAGSDLGDCGLSIPRDGISRTLDQLTQGRSLPGLQPNTGKSGRTGRGQQGSRGRFVMRGPHMPSTGKTDGALGRTTHTRQQGQSPAGMNHWEGKAAESLTVEGETRTTNAAGNLQGVPVGYRDQAEAYFQRLAEEDAN